MAAVPLGPLGRFAGLKPEAGDADDYDVQTHCPHCANSLVVIMFSLDGTDVTMRSCSTCDRRFWATGDTDTDIIDMLGHEPMRQPALR